MQSPLGTTVIQAVVPAVLQAVVPAVMQAVIPAVMQAVIQTVIPAVIQTGIPNSYKKKEKRKRRKKLAPLFSKLRERDSLPAPEDKTRFTIFPPTFGPLSKAFCQRTINL
jgi:hypothetical protein